jgi:hypothetical protein
VSRRAGDQLLTEADRKPRQPATATSVMGKHTTALTLRINSWHEARILADELSLWVFRGQEDATWSLSTALQRGATGENAKALITKIEEQIIEEFQRRAHHFLLDPPELTARMEWLALLQHFGGPTRLLDFTRSFYVAAFFAAEKALAECAIWCINNHALQAGVIQCLERGGSVTDATLAGVAPHGRNCSGIHEKDARLPSVSCL